MIHKISPNPSLLKRGNKITAQRQAEPKDIIAPQQPAALACRTEKEEDVFLIHTKEELRKRRHIVRPASKRLNDVIPSPSCVILNEVKNLFVWLRINSAKNLSFFVELVLR